MPKPKTKPSLKKMLKNVPAPVKGGRPSARVTNTDITGDENVSEMQRKLFVRRFVTSFLKHDMSSAAAYKDVRPNVADSTAQVRGCYEMNEPDVRMELKRQLQGVREALDLDEHFVKAHLKGMANANLFDYLDFDAKGVVKSVRMESDKLTLEQQLNVREVKIDPETRAITSVKIVDRQAAVDSVAKINKMYGDQQSEDAASWGKTIMEILQSSAQRRGRTFDGDTGEEI